MGNGVITPEELAMKLVNAKKVMTKVDNGNFEKGQVNEEILSSDPMELMQMENLNIPTQNTIINETKINNSKLPDEIKRAMIERPIVQPEISLSEGFDLKLAQKAKRLMEQDNGSNKQTPKTKTSSTTITNNSSSINEIISSLTPIIENTIRKVLDEKLTQILTAKETSSLNENLVLKVGDSVFKGKITGVKKSK